MHVFVSSISLSVTYVYKFKNTCMILNVKVVNGYFKFGREKLHVSSVKDLKSAAYFVTINQFQTTIAAFTLLVCTALIYVSR